MARLASQAKMGYYPTPETVLALIKDMLVVDEEAMTAVIDPCCGKGEFKRAMPESVCTFGNELDRERFDIAKQVLDETIFGDALVDLKTTPQAFSGLYLNPPYDWTTDPITMRSTRLERLFLKATTKCLRKEGLLIFVVPYETLADCAQWLAYNYKGIEIYRFPDTEFDAFKQVVLFGYRQNGKDPEMKEHLERLGHWSLWRGPLPVPTLDEAVAEATFKMPPANEIRTFKSNKVDPVELEHVMRTKGDRIDRLFDIPDVLSIKTPMPLRQGHVAMMLASGMMNGEFRKGDKWLVVKGSTKKTVQVDEGEGFKVEKDQINIHLVAMDMNSGDFITIT